MTERDATPDAAGTPQGTQGNQGNQHGTQGHPQSQGVPGPVPPESWRIADPEQRREPAGASFGAPHRPADNQASSWTSASTYRHPQSAPTEQFPQQPPHNSGQGWNVPATATTWAQPPAQQRRGPGWGATIVIALSAALLTSGGTLLATDMLGGGTSVVTTTGGSRITETDPVVTSTTTNPDWANVAAAVGPSVVSIQVLTAGGGGEGSGFVFDDAGHVVTNNHVVEGATTGGITVTLSDGQMLKATIAGTDPATDIAVLTLENPPAHLKAVTFGDSEEVVVGDPVVAIGNPLGLSSTVTTGIVSALDRPVTAQDPSNPSATSGAVTNAIQVDASVNPGNSGGPLFDATGRVIGVTSSIATLSQSSGSVGLGFAIPANLVQRVAPQLIESGRAEHAYLGVSMNDGAATVDGVTRSGARVLRVETGTPAAQAGLQTDDVIVAMDGKSVSGSEALTGYVREHASGDQVTLRYVRAGQATDVTVTLATRPDNL